MAKEEGTKYSVTKIVNTDIEVDIDMQDVLGFIRVCTEKEEYEIKDELDFEETHSNFEHLSREAYNLIQQCGKTLDEDEKLIYFLTNIEDISLEQLKEATSGQQV